MMIMYAFRNKFILGFFCLSFGLVDCFRMSQHDIDRSLLLFLIVRHEHNLPVRVSHISWYRGYTSLVCSVLQVQRVCTQVSPCSLRKYIGMRTMILQVFDDLFVLASSLAFC